MAKFRQIRVKWCELEGGFLTGKRLPNHAIEVLNIFVKAYQLAKSENEIAADTVISYIDEMSKDGAYKVFANKLKTRIKYER